MPHLCKLHVWVAAALLAPAAAYAGCSRVINVPVAATGLSVIADKDTITGGVYPDILHGIQASGQCTFAISLVPRARLELMFRNGSADVLIPATRAPVRDLSGIFVPLIYNRATIISTRSDREPITTAQALLDSPDLKIVLVRGFTYGDAYDSLVSKLEKLGRVQFESDPLGVARAMQANADFMTLMAPSILVGAMKADGRFGTLLKTLRYEPINELPWGDSGAYISKSSLSEADRNELKTMLESAAHSGLVWKKFRQYYGQDVLDQGVRPR